MGPEAAMDFEAHACIAQRLIPQGWNRRQLLEVLRGRDLAVRAVAASAPRPVRALGGARV
jgi:hypothetical protein